MERTILEKDEIKGQQLNPFQKSVKVFFLNIQFSLLAQTDLTPLTSEIFPKLRERSHACSWEKKLQKKIFVEGSHKQEKLLGKQRK